MINLILTPVLSSKPILDKIKSRFDGKSKHLLIVPDRFSMSYERLALEHLGLKGSFDLEVASFSRLADRFLDRKALRLLDKQSEIMLLRKVIDDNKQDMVCFKRAAGLVGFAEEMYAAISQIRNSGVYVDNLENIVDNLPFKVAIKTKDIVLIYRKYVQELQQKYVDGTSKLEAFCDAIPTSELADYHIYLTDFVSLSKVEQNIVKEMMKVGITFDACLVSSHSRNEFIYPNALVDKFVNMAEEIGTLVNIESFTPDMKEDFCMLRDELFACERVDKPSNGESISIFSAPNIQEEIKFVARQINQLVKTKQARYKDITVVCCDFGGYADDINSIFRDFGIAYYCDIKTPLMSQALSNLLVSALRCVSSRYAQKEVIDYAKQTLLGLDYSKVCKFENYCLRYGIEYSRFASQFEFGDEEQRQIAEEIRQAVVSSLESLDKPIFNISQAVQRVRNYLTNLDIQRRCDEFAELQLANGMGVESKVTSQCYGKIEKILDQAESIMNNVGCSLKDFLDILTSAIDSVEISTTPLYVDSVFVGEESTSRFDNTKFMFVLGANEGTFPNQSADNGIVADRESCAWAKQGVIVEPDVKARNRNQKLTTLMTVLQATSKLVVTYSLKDNTMTSQNPSTTIELVEDLCRVKTKPIPMMDRTWRKSQIIRYISNNSNILQEFLNMVQYVKNGILVLCDEEYELLDCLYGVACKQNGQAYVNSLLMGDNIDKFQLHKTYDIAWAKGNYTSASQFEKYFNCPFKHYMDYVLKAKPRAVARLEVSDLGTYLHAIAEKYFLQPDCCDLGREEIEERVYNIFEEIRKEDEKLELLTSRSGGESLKQKICTRSSFMIYKLTQKMQCTAFRPFACEKPFGMGGNESYPPVRIDTGSRVLNIRGVIDRIDKYKDNFFVIDYKSKSSIDFGIKNIIMGDRVQMLIYILAVCGKESFTPAGMFYVLMSDKYTTADKDDERYKYQGYVNLNEDNVEDIDHNLSSSAVGSNRCDIVSTLFNAKRKVNKNATRLDGNIMTAEELVNCSQYAKLLMKKAVQEIDKGYISPRPLILDSSHSACTYCDYKTICAIDKNDVRERHAPSFKMADLKNILGELK